MDFLYLINDLEYNVISQPYDQGYRYLKVLSGYVSPIFIEHVMETYRNLHLEIILGMVSNDGLAVWQHRAFVELVNQYSDRLEIFYHVEQPGNNSKVYHWYDNVLSSRVFLGSANFTRNGFGRHREVLVESTFSNIDDLFGNLTVVRCDDCDIEGQVKFYNALPSRVVVPAHHEHGVPKTVEILSTPLHNYKDYVVIPLLDRSGQVPARSGLNWGQREGRDSNQAYLSVSQSIHQERPDFFPNLAEPFIMITDDGANLVCVMAQQNRKAIHTRGNNSIMGSYFRRRLGLNDGAFVTVEDLQKYGRNNVRIYKIDEETYYMDFSV